MWGVAGWGVGVLPSSFSSNTGGLWEWFPPIFRSYRRYYMPSLRDVRCRILAGIRDAGCSWDAGRGMRARGCRKQAATGAARQGCSVCAEGADCSSGMGAV